MVLKVLRILTLLFLVTAIIEWCLLMPRYSRPGPLSFGTVLIGLAPLLLIPIGAAFGSIFALIPRQNRTFKQKMEFWTYLFIASFALIVTVTIGVLRYFIANNP
jgi:hypothetical protein